MRWPTPIPHGSRRASWPAMLVLPLLLVLAGPVTAVTGPTLAAGIPGPPLETERADAVAERSAAAWRGRFCTPAGCRPPARDPLGASAGFGLAVIAAGWLAHRRRAIPG